MEKELDLKPSEEDDDEFEVDWEHEYEKANRDFEKLQRIPLEERVKIIRKKMEKVKNMKEVSDIEAVFKYCDNKFDLSRSLIILRYYKSNGADIVERQVFSSGFLDCIDPSECYDPLLKAIKKAIEANDCPCVMALSRGCYIPSVLSIMTDKVIYSLFGYSCKMLSDECALFLIEAGGGVNQMFGYGRTILMEALAAGNESIAMYLIEEGANINVKTDSLSTELHAAALGNCYEVAKYLIAKGVNVNANDEDRFTPLHRSAAKNSFEITKLFIEKGADVNAKSGDGVPAIFYTVARNLYEMTKLLIQSGANIEVRNNDLNTPLHRAAYWNHFEIVKLLIEKGANVKAKNKDGLTPFQVTSNSRIREILMDAAKSK